MSGDMIMVQNAGLQAHEDLQQFIRSHQNHFNTEVDALINRAGAVMDGQVKDAFITALSHGKDVVDHLLDTFQQQSARAQDTHSGLVQLDQQLGQFSF